MQHNYLFEEMDESLRTQRSGSFVDNMQLPVHRWFRYSAGFSAEWVGQLLRERNQGKELRVLDPFAGSGTVVLEAERIGVDAVGIEAHPFVARIAQAKLLWREDWRLFRRLGLQIIKTAHSIKGSTDGYPSLIMRCFPPAILRELDSLKKAWEQHQNDSPTSKLCWLAFISILRMTSPAGTAQWQYVLPKKTKAKSRQPFEAFAERIQVMARDMDRWQAEASPKKGLLFCEDARLCPSVSDGWADLIVTSPPYANNYDYADATRLEMTFLREINGWGDLQSTIREYLIRSCTQHVAPIVADTRDILEADELAPIRKELSETCSKLEGERQHHGGKKPYHVMIAHYFFDLAKVWKTLRRVTRKGAHACFVIGDSAPYGIYVPVDRWLGELAIATSFKKYHFEKLRDRNTKWKNRKHKILLHEGRLWVEG